MPRCTEPGIGELRASQDGMNGVERRLEQSGFQKHCAGT
jgi:hypothetical protein